MLTTTEIVEQYPAFGMWGYGHARTLYENFLKENTEPLLEFLSTVSTKDTMKRLHDLRLEGVSHIFESPDDNKMIVVLQIVDRSHVDKVNVELDKLGWFPAMIQLDDSGYKKKYSSTVNDILKSNTLTYPLVIVYEAKYDQEIDITDGYLYHVTPDIKYPRILTAGLTPKSQAKISNHPGRIYFIHKFNHEPISYFKMIADMFYNTYKNKDLVRDMYVLQIDVSKVKNTKFYKDNNFLVGDAVWTNENIPPYAIKKIADILVNNKVEDKSAKLRNLKIK